MLALLLHAHGPLVEACGPGTDYSESDLRTLLALGDCLEHNNLRLEPRPYFAAGEAGLEPLAALSLAISSALWSQAGAFGAASPLPLRIENLLLFTLAAIGAAVFLRRLVSPWLGDEHARAAAWVTAVLCLVHPLAYTGLVSFAARGDLIALCLCTWSGAQFLRARQARAPRAAIRAGIGTLLAGFASPLAWAIPFALAASEFIAARRYRAFAARLRSTLVTFAVYAACAAAAPVLRAALGFAVAGQPAHRPAIETAALALEKLGVLALPVNPASLTFAAYLLAAALLVVALEPAFSAARSAPRLWSLILAVAAVAILSASFVERNVRVQPGDFTRAEILLPGLFLVSAGLALAATALTGTRRALMPAILASGWAAIAHVHAGAFAQAVQRFDAARLEVASALTQDPPPAAILLLDLPALVQGLAPLDRSRAQTFLADPRLIAKDGAGLERERARLPRPQLVAAPTQRAFAQFSRSERFAQLRSQGIVLAQGGATAGQRTSLSMPPPAPSTSSRRWFRDGASSPLDWEALTTRFVTARGARDTDYAQVPRLGWSAARADGHVTEAEIEGVWLKNSGEPQACFDVAESIPWLCAGRVTRAWPVGGWSNLIDSDAQDELPTFVPGAAPTDSGEDWLVPEPASPLIAAAASTLERRGLAAEWSLLLCDLETLEQQVFELELDLTATPPQRVARRAGRVAAEWSGRGHTSAWSIEYAAGGVVLVRSEGVLKPKED